MTNLSPEFTSASMDPAATVAADQLLTNSERWELWMDWGPVELNQFASFVLTSHPLVFDAAAAYVGQCFNRSADKAAQNGDVQ